MGDSISLVAAFTGGVVSFLSPCVLPMVPAYFTYLVSGPVEGVSRKVLLLRALGFILGFSVVFIALGATASVIGKFMGANKSLLRELSGVAMIFFGLHMLGIFRLSWLYREKRFDVSPKAGSAWYGSFVLGLAFAAGWTPCIGPVLASILLFAGSESTALQGIMLLSTYSLGLALPFFVAALAAHGLRERLSRINRLLPIISKVSGVLMIGFGYLVFNDRLQWLNSYFNFFR